MPFLKIVTNFIFQISTETQKYRRPACSAHVRLCQAARNYRQSEFCRAIRNAFKAASQHAGRARRRLTSFPVFCGDF